jgi:hypothetical protein
MWNWVLLEADPARSNPAANLPELAANEPLRKGEEGGAREPTLHLDVSGVLVSDAEG